MTPRTTENQLRETLQVVARHVEPDPNAYPRALRAWKRRERRRRLLVALLAALVIAIDVALGIWALDHAAHDHRSRPTPVASFVTQLQDGSQLRPRASSGTPSRRVSTPAAPRASL